VHLAIGALQLAILVVQSSPQLIHLCLQARLDFSQHPEREGGRGVRRDEREGDPPILPLDDVFGGFLEGLQLLRVVIPGAESGREGGLRYLSRCTSFSIFSSKAVRVDCWIRVS
jgi:hypothetical protein